MTGFDRAQAKRVLRRIAVLPKGFLREQDWKDLEACVMPAQVLSAREVEWVVDVANEGIAELLNAVQQIEFDPVATDDEMDAAITYGVRADCGRRAVHKLEAARGGVAIAES